MTHTHSAAALQAAEFVQARCLREQYASERLAGWVAAIGFVVFAVAAAVHLVAVAS